MCVLATAGDLRAALYARARGDALRLRHRAGWIGAGIVGIVAGVASFGILTLLFCHAARPDPAGRIGAHIRHACRRGGICASCMASPARPFHRWCGGKSSASQGACVGVAAVIRLATSAESAILSQFVERGSYQAHKIFRAALSVSVALRTLYALLRRLPGPCGSSPSVTILDAKRRRTFAGRPQLASASRLAVLASSGAADVRQIELHRPFALWTTVSIEAGSEVWWFGWEGAITFVGVFLPCRTRWRCSDGRWPDLSIVVETATSDIIVLPLRFGSVLDGAEYSRVRRSERCGLIAIARSWFL